MIPRLTYVRRGRVTIERMTPDERAQLVEDIKRSAKTRHDIAERAELSKDFDIAAAWEVLADVDDSIRKGITKARLKE
jgi:hypothetical protein